MDTKLVGFKPNGDRFEIPLTAVAAIVGRSDECDIPLPINSVSRKHCEFSVADGVVRIRDLGSANGTFVNQNRISEVSLSAGDRIVIGSLAVTLQIDGQPADISPAPAAKPAPAPAVAPVEAEDLAAEAISLDGDDVALAAAGAEADDGPISLSGDSAVDDPFGALADDDAGGEALAADVFGDLGGDDVAPAAVGAEASDDGSMPLADDSAVDDPFAALAGGEASAADVLGEDADGEIDPISALEMLAGEDEDEDDPLASDI